MNSMRLILGIGGICAFGLNWSGSSGIPFTQALSGGRVKQYQKISENQGNFAGSLDPQDHFGGATTTIGDLDRDGVTDLAVGVPGDDDGGFGRGAVWVIFLNPDGTVKSQAKISDTDGGFNGVLDNSDGFGASVAGLGDLDGDSVPDLAVGALGDDDGGLAVGAIWILFLNMNGTVKSHAKVSATQGGFTGDLDDVDTFGCSLGLLGDLDGDGVNDLAAGALHDDDGGGIGGGIDRGAMWILFLNANGTVKAHQKISDTQGGFLGILNDFDQFGVSVSMLEDLDGDDVDEIAVGDTANEAQGTFWILFLEPNGTVKAHQRIGEGLAGFTGDLEDGDLFGVSLKALGDLDGDGVDDLAVGSRQDDDGGLDRGAVWVLTLDPDGTVKSHQKISDSRGGFTGGLADEDYFGVSLAPLGDLDGDGAADMAVGAAGDDDGGLDQGAVWILFLGRTKHQLAPSPSSVGTFVVPMTVASHRGQAIVVEPLSGPGSAESIPLVFLCTDVTRGDLSPTVSSVFAVLVGTTSAVDERGRVTFAASTNAILPARPIYAVGAWLDTKHRRLAPAPSLTVVVE